MRSLQGEVKCTGFNDSLQTINYSHTDVASEVLFFHLSLFRSEIFLPWKISDKTWLWQVFRGLRVLIRQTYVRHLQNAHALHLPDLGVANTLSAAQGDRTLAAPAKRRHCRHYFLAGLGRDVKVHPTCAHTLRGGDNEKRNTKKTREKKRGRGRKGVTFTREVTTITKVLECITCRLLPKCSHHATQFQRGPNWLITGTFRLTMNSGEDKPSGVKSRRCCLHFEK